MPPRHVRIQMTKWGDRPHWRFDGTWLGEDEHGQWIGFPAGTHHSRPGMEVESRVDSVTLAPHDGWFMATFQAPGNWCEVYVDIATPPVWDGDVVTSTDLDLDVVRLAPVRIEEWTPPGITAPGGGVWLDDEDEFEEHRVEYGYPQDVVDAARASAEALMSAVRAGETPYDGSHRRWLEVLAGR